MNDQNPQALLFIPALFVVLFFRAEFLEMSGATKALLTAFCLVLGTLFLLWGFSKKSTSYKERKKNAEILNNLPVELLGSSDSSVYMGEDVDLGANIFLPDNIRTRHVHILGATGSGKTESVILNFLKQDVARGLGTIILDAKGDQSFLNELNQCVPEEKLLVFDLGSKTSLSYNPLLSGSALESAQRLFSSMTWSEEYYKSKALSSLQRIFQTHFEVTGRNPTLIEISQYLETPKTYSSFVSTEDFQESLAIEEFRDLSGLRDQVRSLTLGNLEKSLSPVRSDIDLFKASEGYVIYFRLQSLISPQIVAVLGKLVINHLNFIAGTTHRENGTEKKEKQSKERKLVPIYFDEFASFACVEFADLISKARSAKFALHFSHQSIGDIMEVSKGFLNRITDNAATKIVLRINDPESAEFFARSFGTKEYQKTTQRITNTKEIEDAEIVGEGTAREAHQFRASPDLLKTLPTGMGAVLIAHGQDKHGGASAVFKIRFPNLKSDRRTNNIIILGV
jgi:hypothetical protein